MSLFKHLITAGALFLSALSPTLYAQGNNISRTAWLKQMEQEEQKIADFVDRQMNNAAQNDSLSHAFMAALPQDEVPEASLDQFAQKRLEGYYRQQYFDLHPDAVKRYNPGNVPFETGTANKPTGATPNLLCTNGDFESATSSSLVSMGYNGYGNPPLYLGGLCSSVPTTNVTYTNVGFSNPDNFLVTNNIPDPNIPAINQTHNGSLHALRINGYLHCDNFGRNMLQKSFSSSISGKARINFSYAVVIQAPHSGADANGNAFFVARILNSAGTEVGSRICINSSSSGFQTTALPDCRNVTTTKTIWKDWSCDFIEFDAQAGQTYTIEFFVSSCQWNVHYAYAYLDDICADIICCKTPPAPGNPKCTPRANGCAISWDPVPGAVYYKVIFNKNDPACCHVSNPHPTSVMWNTNNTSLAIANTLAYCFSWQVFAVMPDSCQTPFTDKQCSCTPPPPGPIGLDCDSLPDGSRLSWTAVPGAAYYQVTINQYDPACCPSPHPPNPVSLLRNVGGTSTDVSNLVAGCFSWWITAIMTDSTRSLPSDTKCSCGPSVPAPVGLDCAAMPDGSNQLSWTAVPGAAYYKVIISTYDPRCCGVPPYGFSTTMNAATNTFNVPNTYPCFSWRLVTVMPDSTMSDISEFKCSCGRQGQKPGSPETIGESLSVTATPNPASEYIDFTARQKGFTSDPGGLTLYLYDVNGKEVIRQTMNAQGRLHLNVRTYPAGMYIYEIRREYKVVFRSKVLIKKD
ncbi:T9SS type A sorting domain-containing protein [Taibaiella koreensis]|uniref:T9SS type A sorting domain-containing protein n=1 Tax=Taibaiella koreensis TaxID=1268548 RepID=UPI0013C2F871|nr:T9SS type A sorting domain-containing protein [Taibaiella koreensis]